jgi:nitrate/nitrite-specific signal transduction histidine kinase
MRERAALLGGWIRIDSAPGQGTSIEAEFPVQRGGDQYDAAPKENAG